MSNWKSYKLGDFADVQTGPFGSQLHASDYVATGIPSIMPVNIVDHKIEEAGVARIKAEDAERLSKYLVATGDIVFSRRGEIHRRALITDKENGWLCGTGCLRARLRSTDEVDPQFLYFYLGIDEVRDWLYGHAVGTSMPNLNSGILSNLPIALPDLPTQRRIAEILSALDDKIELNRRMNQTLEQIAQTLFRQYFVDGIDEENLPEGWRVEKLGSVCNIFRGASPRPITDPKYFSNGTIPWIKIGDATAESSIYINSTKEHCTELAVTKSRFLKKGSLILSNSATVGIPKILNLDGCIHDGWLSFNKFETITRNFLFFVLVLKLREFNQIATGSVQNNLNTSLLKETEFILPPVNLINKFDEQCELLFQKMLSNEIETSKLITLRDTLLPKLMSGEIDVMQSKILEQHEPVLS